MKPLFIDPKRPRSAAFKSQKGQIIVMFGLLIVILLAVTGYAIDTANAAFRRAQLRRSLDAGAIAGMSNFSDGLTQAEAENYAVRTATFNLTEAGIVPAAISNVTAQLLPANADGVRVLRVTGTVTVNTMFMKLVGIPTTTVNALADAARNPAAIALVLDTSASMEDSLPLLKTAANNFVGKFQPNVDQIAVVSFNHNVFADPPFGRRMGTFALTSDLTSIINNLNSSGDTNIPEALATARQEIEKGINDGSIGPTAVKAIVLFTDGAPNAMRLRFEQPDIKAGPLTPGGNPLPQNNPLGYGGNTYDYSIFSRWHSVKNRGYQKIFRPGDVDKLTDFIPPCADPVSPFYENPLDCLNSFQYIDVKNNFQDIYALVNNDSGMTTGQKGVSGILRVVYTQAIIESDYAKNGLDGIPGTNDDITIYVIGLGPAADEELPSHQCVDGQWLPQDKSCSFCLNGTEAKADRSNCTTCAGDGVEVAQSSDCLECANGSIVADRRRCAKCKDGQEAEAGRSNCTTCAGDSVEVKNKLGCVKCKDGRELSNSSKCTRCTGDGVEVAESSDCLECANGLTVVDKNSCAKCKDGQEAEADRSNCTTCAGDHGEVAQSSDCLECANGSMVADRSNCLMCKDKITEAANADGSDCPSVDCWDGVHPNGWKCWDSRPPDA